MDNYDSIPIMGISQPFSSMTHLLACFVFAVASVVLVRKSWGNPVRVFSVSLYSICFLYMFSMSGVFHLLEPGSDAREVLQRMDRSSIWAAIAGTFTPLHIILFRGFWRWGILAAIWIAAITGLVLEVIYMKDLPEFLTLTFYLVLGWMGALTSWRLVKCYPEKSVKSIVLGGMSYSLGAVLDFIRWPNPIPGVINAHDIWHLFVMGGAYFHWQFIYFVSDFAITDKLAFVVKYRPGGHYFVRAKTERIELEAMTKEEIYKLLKQKVVAIYPAYTKPKAIKISIQHEEFINTFTEHLEYAKPVDFFGKRHGAAG